MIDTKRSEVRHGDAMYYVWHDKDGKIARVTTIDGRPVEVPKGMAVPGTKKPAKATD